MENIWKHSNEIENVKTKSLDTGLEVDAVWKQRQIDLDNSHKKHRIVDSGYQQQKVKTKETESKDIRNTKQRLVIDAEMRTKIFILFFIRMH